MEQKKRKYTFMQMLTLLIYLMSGRRIAVGPVRRAMDKQWVATVVRNQRALDAEHEAGKSVRFIDGKNQHFRPFSSNPDFKAVPGRN